MNNDNILNWFKNRGISAETLRKMSVTDGKEWMPANPSKGVRLPNGGETEVIKFNYLKDGEIVATKLLSKTVLSASFHLSYVKVTYPNLDWIYCKTI